MPRAEAGGLRCRRLAVGRLADAAADSDAIYGNQGASIGSRIDGNAISLNRLWTSPKIKITNTAQTKAAFHHGSTVPYGIAATTIKATNAAKMVLFSN